MNRALRLVWVLLALALPLQGLAAATMIACGPAHPHDVAHALDRNEASAHEAQGGVTSAHHHDEHAPRLGAVAEHAHADALAADSTAADDPMAADDPSSTTPGQKCSVCASCCTTSAGLPTAAVVAEPAALADSHVDEERATPPAFLTGGPERPPRSFLA
jgi:hypothetical protein